MVAGLVVALVFAVEVVGPVFVEVAVGVQGAEFEDGFGGLHAPAGAGAVHAVFYQVAAGAFGDAGGMGHPLARAVATCRAPSRMAAAAGTIGAFPEE